MKIIKLILLLLLSSQILFANTYYVSNSGNNDDDGSIASPFKTISYLLNIVQAGDSGLVRGGVYILEQTTKISGTQTEKIYIGRFQNEHVILAGTGNLSNGSMFRLKHNWYIFEGLEFKDGAAGMRISSNASHDSIVNCSSHNHYYDGFYLTGGASNINLVNCDAYDMFDSGTDGGNADGFSINGQDYDLGSGNKMTGCRAFNNSDDGFDVWKASYPVEITNCYSFNNGNHSGDGNGFKLGVNKTSDDKHVLKNCVAWGNKQNGFDYNDNTLPQTLYNCTAYNNFRNYKFSNIGGGPTIDDIQNCISITTTEDDVLLQTIIDNNTNSWNLVSANQANVVSDNFISTDDIVISGQRNIDGTIPDSDFLKLKNYSIFIDSGVDVGLPYNGVAPDFGAFETPTTIKVRNVETNVYNIYPNPATNFICINTSKSTYNYYIIDVFGSVVKLLRSNNKSQIINIKNLQKGIYFLIIDTKQGNAVKKFIKQ